MQLNKKKEIPLDKFIYEALYNKKIGYYMKKNPFGKEGDYLTSPNISILFSEMIAIWTVAFWENLNCPKKINLVELGSGNAEMIYQMNLTFNKFPSFKKSCKIYIYEKSNYLKKIQKKKLVNYKINWLNNFKEIEKGPTLFIGNEFFDSLPIKQLIKKKNLWFEKYVNFSNKKKLSLTEKKINIKKVEKKIDLKISKKQNFIEYSPISLILIKKMSSIIKKQNGGLLIIDYGFLKNKMFNTIQGIKKHKKVDIFKNLSNTDITHLISFKLLEKIAKKFKMKVNGISTQRNFLITLGILKRAEIISKKLSFTKKANIYYRLNRLIGKNQMGELFKVMFITNNKINFKLGF